MGAETAGFLLIHLAYFTSSRSCLLISHPHLALRSNAPTMNAYPPPMIP
ncbi:MAG: hypothetical protein M5U34_17875 [Chloroflexi bacterium]|nr:hypothetical protein [Chloroflexota bacterium]